MLFRTPRKPRPIPTNPLPYLAVCLLIAALVTLTPMPRYFAGLIHGAIMTAAFLIATTLPHPDGKKPRK